LLNDPEFSMLYAKFNSTLNALVENH